jgi:hypothetical protein
MNIAKSKVYVKIDERSLVTQCAGGYTTPKDLSGWVQIDEGIGDKYNLCQSHYFEEGLYTFDGIPRYKLVDGAPIRRTEEEIQVDRDALPKPEDPNKRIEEMQKELAAITAAISRGTAL